jgi:hypothetical protein
MTDPQSSTKTIAGREGCSVRKINKTISLAFLAPDLVKAAIDERLRYGLGVAPLRPARGMVPSAPDAWSSRVVATTFGPVFIQDRSASGKRDSSAQRQTAQNRLQARNGLRGDRNAAARARQLRAPWPSPGNLAVRKSARWGSESNHLPEHYARPPRQVMMRWLLRQLHHLRAASIARAKTRPAKRDCAIM